MDETKIHPDLKDDELRSRLREWLHAHDYELPLENACHGGGRAKVTKIDVGPILRENHEVSCIATIHFTGVIPTSCATVDRKNEQACTIRVVVDEDSKITPTFHDDLYGGDRCFD